MEDIHDSSVSNSFLQNLFNAKDSEYQFSVLEKIAKESQFDGIFYTFIPQLLILNKNLHPVFQHTRSYSDYYKHYEHNDLYKYDPSIRLIKDKNLEILDWYNAIDKKIITNENEIETALIAKSQFGINSLISIPIQSDDQGIAFVTLVSRLDDAKLDKKQNTEFTDYFKPYAESYHDFVMMKPDSKRIFLNPVIDSFTSKQKDVIKFLISGKPMKNISDETDITIRYAEKLMCELRKNFGKISTNELIYMMGLLNISEHL